VWKVRTFLSLRLLGQAVRLLSRERQVELLTRGVQEIFTNVRVGDPIDIAVRGAASSGWSHAVASWMSRWRRLQPHAAAAVAAAAAAAEAEAAAAAAKTRTTAPRRRPFAWSPPTTVISILR
jgi:hypothetical protein